jgi:hypothetical protein
MKSMAKRLVLMLVILLLASILLVISIVDAQTVAEWKFLKTPEGIEPIKVSISYPENLSSFTSNNITLFFNATAPKPDSFPNLESNSEGSFYNWVWSYYNASWLSANDNYKDCNISGPFDALKGNVTIQNIPVGNHYLEIGVGGLYLTERTLLTATGYRLFSSVAINFTILPSVTILSPENKTYTTSTINLNYVVNESATKIAYSLDGKSNVAVKGNTTLTGLSNGEHHLTVYTNDTLGNRYASQTIDFSVKATNLFLTIAVIVIPIAAVLIVGLLLYRRHRKKANLKK